MKKRISLILAAIMILAVMVPAIPVVAVSNTFNASDANPTISTAADYVAFFNAVWRNGTDFANKTVTMAEDIVLNDTTAANWYAKDDLTKLLTSSDKTTSGTWFKGTFDGAGHTLKGVVVEGSAGWAYASGVFPAALGATIKDLTVDGFYVSTSGAKATGGLIGRVADRVTIQNVTLRNGSVNAANCDTSDYQRGVGAMVGYLQYGDNSRSNNNVKIENCVVEGTVSVTGDDTIWAGGIVGAVRVQHNNHADFIFAGSEFRTAGKDLPAVGNYYQNSGDYQLVLNNGNGNKWSGSGNGDKTAWVVETIDTFGIYTPSVIGAVSNTFNANDANPTISTAEDYVAFFNATFKDGNSFSGKTITLLQDIVVNDTSASEWYKNSDVIKFTGGDKWSWFEGNFDGNGKTVSGVVVDGYYRSSGDKVTGLFPHARYGSIKNVTFDGFYVSANGAQAVGGLIGRVGNSMTVQGVTLKNGTVNATNSDNSGNQRGVGALIGYVYFDADEQTVVATDCVVDGSVLVTCDDTNWAGGIIGAIQLQNKNHATINFKGSNFSTMSNDLLAVGYYNQNANGGYQLKLTNDGTSNKWSGGGTGEKTAWVNETIDTFGIYTPPTVWFAGIQTRSSDDAVRFVGLIKIPADLNDVSALGFEVTVGDKTVDVNCTKVYTSIIENGQAKAAPDGYYYFTFAITGVTVGTTFTVKTCATVNGTDYTTASSTYTYAA